MLDKPPPENSNSGIQHNQNLKEICLAGGCFWGVQAFMARIPGVSGAVSGYANGKTAQPTYREVCSGESGHAEAVLVRYDPYAVSLERLLRFFVKIIDPTQRNRQGNDIGRQYRTGIYYTDPADRAVAEAVLSGVRGTYAKPIVTEVLPLENFHKAEEYHQDYLQKHPGGYCHVDFSILNEIKPDGDCDEL